MMLSYKTINEFVSRLAPDIKVIRQELGKKSPERPYCAWKLMSGATNGLANISNEDSGAFITEKAQTSKKANVEVQFYTETTGKSARDYQIEATGRISLSSNIIFASRNKFSVLNFNDYENIDQHLSDNWERRAVFEMTLNYTDSITDQIQYFEQSDVTTKTDILNEEGNPI